MNPIKNYRKLTVIAFVNKPCSYKEKPLSLLSYEDNLQLLHHILQIFATCKMNNYV
jgi:hypothetical protein